MEVLVLKRRDPVCLQDRSLPDIQIQEFLNKPKTNLGTNHLINTREVFLKPVKCQYTIAAMCNTYLNLKQITLVQKSSTCRYERYFVPTILICKTSCGDSVRVTLAHVYYVYNMYTCMYISV